MSLVPQPHLAPQTYANDETDDVPASTRWHRAHGRQTRRQRAVQQQLLTPQQEKALVNHLLRLSRNEFQARVKHLRYFAGILLRQRDSNAGTLHDPHPLTITCLVRTGLKRSASVTPNSKPHE